MRKHITHSTLIGLIALFCSFSFQATKPVIIPVKDNLRKESQFLLSEIASDIQIIQLETKDECLIGAESIFQFVDNYIFVSSDDNLYRFDDRGKFLNTIGKKGQGPGEYTYCFQFTINPHTKKAYILMANSMHEYEYDGTFLRTIPIKSHNLGAYSFLDKDHLIYSNDSYHYSEKNEEEQLYIIRLEDEKTIGKIKSRIEPRLRGVLNLSSFDLFYSLADDIYFKGSLQDEIYKIQIPKQKDPVWIFDIGHFKKDNSNKKGDIDPRNRLKGIQIQNIYETTDYLLFSYSYESRLLQGVYDKKKKTMTNAVNLKKEDGIINDLIGGPSIITYPFQIHPAGKLVLPWRSMEYLLENKDQFLISDPRLPKRQKEWEKILDNIDEDSNPILMIVTIK